jgi:hypothetical protein
MLAVEQQPAFFDDSRPNATLDRLHERRVFSPDHVVECDRLRRLSLDTYALHDVVDQAGVT